MKTVLITGAAGGLGRAVIEKMLGLGYRVIAVDIAESEMDAINARNGLESHVLDVTDPARLQSFGHELSARLEKLDLVICLAGIYQSFPVTEGNQENFNRMMQVNFLSAANVIQTFLPYLLKAKGKVILVSSESYKIQAMFQPYMVSKAALESYARAAWQELALKGVRLVLVRPGPFKTGLLSWMDREPPVSPASLYKDEHLESYRVSKKLVGRIVSAEKVAEIIVRAAEKKHPKRVYTVNNNPLLNLIALIPPGILGKIMVARFRKKKA